MNEKKFGQMQPGFDISASNFSHTFNIFYEEYVISESLKDDCKMIHRFVLCFKQSLCGTSTNVIVFEGKTENFVIILTLSKNNRVL